MDDISVDQAGIPYLKIVSPHDLVPCPRKWEVQYTSIDRELTAPLRTPDTDARAFGQNPCREVDVSGVVGVAYQSGARSLVAAELLAIPGVDLAIVLDRGSGFPCLKPGEVAVAVVGDYSDANVGSTLYRSLPVGVVCVVGRGSRTFVNHDGRVLSAWFTSFKDLYRFLDERTALPKDPLDEEVDGLPLRDLLSSYRLSTQACYRFTVTPAQKQALSRYWSSQLRQKVKEGTSQGYKAWEKERRDRDRARVAVEADW